MRTLPSIDAETRRVACRVELTGGVQGIGLRPAVARLAEQCHVGGHVGNSLAGVEIAIEGHQSDVDEFVRRLPDSLPESARLKQMTIHGTTPTGEVRFSIRPAASEAGALQTPVPRDVVMCQECLSEIATSGDRRYGYPFTSCTQCGPRFSIVTEMPFERADSAMAGFPLCPQCHAEYVDPGNRRFHAQTTACPMCGPQVWSTDRTGEATAVRGAAVSLAANCLRQGGIVALRGIGGYQLLCDATSDRAVERLRQLKGRSSKPLAIMVISIDEAIRLATVDRASQEALVSAANPIVLLPARNCNGLATAIHPGLNTLGVLLPTSPLHWLLLRESALPLVVTSGNREARPLETTPAGAQAALHDIADFWLHHDRPVQHPVDDSVVRIIAGRPVSLRVGRGLAPLPLPIDIGDRQDVFAVGGHQKSAFALSTGEQAILGQHVGDLDGVESREHYIQQAGRINHLYRARPQRWVHDFHPEYFATLWALAQPGVHVAVQHHHAHIVAGMVEQGWLDREVLGVAFDGTGYGPDGTVWGGEFLRTTVQGFRRVAHLRPFLLLGGTAAIREPVRVAIALAHQAVRTDQPNSGLNRIELESTARLRPLLENSKLSLATSSAGRLFDGVSALILGISKADYEGQPAQVLEAISDTSEPHSYSLPLNSGDVLEVDWRPMIGEILVDRMRGVSPGTMAMRFHRGLARAIADVCGRFINLPIVLGGGVFQNRLLVELLVEHLQQHPLPLGLPGLIPPNDGGLAAGQLVIGLDRNGSDS